MRNDYYANSKDYINRWVVSYADLVTMLLALFMVMFAILQIDNQKLTALLAEMQKKVHGQSPIENVTKYQDQIQDNIGYYTSYNNNNYGTDALEKMFKDNLAQSKSIKLIKENRGLVIRVNDTMLFDEGSSIIKPKAEKTLNEIEKVLTKIDNPVIIEGHTDSKPIKNTKFPSNWELSTARATNIISYMMKKKKISPKRLCAVGYGEYMPIADNTSISGRILNRRVDIIVLEKKN